MGGSGIHLTVGAVVGLCSRWEASNMLQRACGAMGPGDWTVGPWGFFFGPGIAATLKLGWNPDPSKAYWMVSVTRHAASDAFWKPHPRRDKAFLQPQPLTSNRLHAETCGNLSVC